MPKKAPLLYNLQDKIGGQKIWVKFFSCILIEF